MPSIGVVFKKYREKFNISQENFANKLGISQNFLSQVENGRKTISFSRLEVIAQRLKCSKELLLLVTSDTPSELSHVQQKDFQDMQTCLLEYMLMGTK